MKWEIKHKGIVAIILLAFVLCHNTYSQRNNPFEVKQRLGQIKPVASNDTLSLNFNTGDSTSAIITSTPNQQLIPADTTRIDTTKTSLANPFDVDHIPLRRSQFDKRKEKLVTGLSATKKSNSFLVWFLLLSCAFLAIVINTRSKTLSFIPQTVYNENMLKLVHREESGKISSFFILLYLIFAINLSITIYLISGHFGGPRGLGLLLKIIAIVVFTYIGKHFFLTVLGVIFDISKSTSLYNFTIIVFNSFIGMCLLPLNFVIAYSPENIKQYAVYFTIGIVGILLLLRYLRGVFIASEYIFSRLFQFFIYLCAFEIAPIVIGIKILTKYVL